MDIFALYKALDRGDVERIYLMTGEEKYLYDQVIEKMEKTLLNPSLVTFNLVKFGEEASYDQVTDALETLPMMDERKIVILERQKTSGAFDLALLEKYLERPSDTTVFILYLAQVDKRRKLYKAFAKHGEVVNFDRLSPQKLSGWLAKQFKLKGKAIETGTLRLMIERTGYAHETSRVTLYDLQHLVERLSHASTDPLVTEQMVVDEVKPSLEHNIFLFTDALSEGRAKDALLLLHALLADGAAEMMITYMIVRQYRLMNKVAMLREEGYSPKLIAEKLAIHPYVAKKLSHQSAGRDLNTLRRYLELAVGVERDMKSTRVQPVQRIERFIFELAGEA